MNIAKRWLRAALGVVHREWGIVPMRWNQATGGYEPVSFQETEERMWQALQAKSDEAGEANQGQYNEP